MFASLYIDPSATTVLISSLGGIAIAVGATAALLWRKAKKQIAALFHIDLNANKEVEGPLEVYDEAIVCGKEWAYADPDGQASAAPAQNDDRAQAKPTQEPTPELKGKKTA